MLALQAVPGSVCPDVALDAENFSRVGLAVKHVFITETETETNFLAFPQVRDGIVIFGAGYGWKALSRSHWLKHWAMYYWGDIGTHGFGILDRLRGYFGHVDSFLIDGETLDARAPVWGSEDSRTTATEFFQPTAELGERFHVPQLALRVPGELQLFDDLEVLEYW